MAKMSLSCVILWSSLMSSLLSLSSADLTAKASLVTVPDVSHSHNVNAPSSGNMTLSCRFNTTEEVDWFSVKWEGEEEEKEDKEKNGKGKETMILNNSKMRIMEEEGNSILTLLEPVEAGTFRCRRRDDVDKELEFGEFKVKVLFKLEKWQKSYTVVQGEDTKLYCSLKPESVSRGTSKFRWFKKAEDDTGEGKGEELVNNDAVKDPHLFIINEDRQSYLKLEDAVFEDRGNYTCVVENEMGMSQTQHTLLRVKDKYAALYPFVGIVVEVVVLCLIILICERRRTSKEIAEDDEDDGYNGAAPGTGNSNLRHRRN